jgi:hypothetical protein
MANSLEKAASKTRGAIKGAKATFKGLSGVFKHLMEEHGKVAGLMMRLKMSSDAEKRRELYPTIRSELMAHERGELNVVYPELERYPQTSGIAGMHSEQAGELQAAIAAVDALAYSDAGWQSAFDRLVELVDAHVKQEESDFFPRAQKALGDKKAEALLPRYEAAKHDHH